MGRKVLIGVCLTIILVAGGVLAITGRTIFVPDFPKATGLKFVGIEDEDLVRVHNYEGQVDFATVERAAIAEMSARGYQSFPCAEGREFTRGGLKGMLLRGTRAGRMYEQPVKAKGWTSFWYGDEKTLLGQLGEGLDVD